MWIQQILLVLIVLIITGIICFGLIKYNQYKRNKCPILMIGNLENRGASVAQCQFCKTIFLFPRLTVPARCPYCHNTKIPD